MAKKKSALMKALRDARAKMGLTTWSKPLTEGDKKKHEALYSGSESERIELKRRKSQ